MKDDWRERYWKNYASRNIEGVPDKTDTNNFIMESFIQELLDEEGKEKKELIEALFMMYNQYCQDGHAFMTAGESASDILEHYGYANFDEAGRITHIKSTPSQ